MLSCAGVRELFSDCWDFVRHARERDSASAREVASVPCRLFALPLHVSLEYDLLFERFLDVSRLEAPDIDIDFCKERRSEVIIMSRKVWRS